MGVGLRQVGEVFLAALRLGLTSFGGQNAHFAYFRQEYVVKRQWLDDDLFSELLTVAQVLPGPSSSQLGMAIGHPGAPAGGVRLLPGRASRCPRR